MAKKIADADILEDLVKKALEQGADNAAVVPVSAIETDAGFRRSEEHTSELQSQR